MKTRQIVSLTKSAERMPLAKTTATSSSAGWCMWLPINCAVALKNRAMRRCAMSTIMPKSSTRVRKSICL